jgi:hypothetical protein
MEVFMSSEEVKTENSSQDEKTYSQEQFKGLLADKQAEVKKRQDAEKQIADLQAKVETLTTRTPRDNGENGEQDRPLTMGQFKQLMAEQNKLSAENAFALRKAECERKALGEMTAQEYGEGLDYGSVVAAGEANLTEGDRLAIKASKDPAAETYRRCVMLTPELAEKAEAVRTSKLLENIKLTGKVPASGPAVETAVTEADVSKMSEEELDQLAESIG